MPRTRLLRGRSLCGLGDEKEDEEERELDADEDGTRRVLTRKVERVGVKDDDDSGRA
jgi:hypothetical protein